MVKSLIKVTLATLGWLRVGLDELKTFPTEMIFYNQSVINWSHFQFHVEIGMLGAHSSHWEGQGSRAFLASHRVWIRQGLGPISHKKPASSQWWNHHSPSRPCHYSLLDLMLKTPAKCNFPPFPRHSAQLQLSHKSFREGTSLFLQTHQISKELTALSGVRAFQPFSLLQDISTYCRCPK